MSSAHHADSVGNWSKRRARRVAEQAAKGEKEGGHDVLTVRCGQAWGQVAARPWAELIMHQKRIMKSVRKCVFGAIMISPAQCRAARALLHWSQDDLSGKAAVGKRTIASFEHGTHGRLQGRIEAALESAFEAAGIEMIEQNGGGDGVRFKRPVPRFMSLFRKTNVDYRGWIAFVFNYRGGNHTGFVRYEALGIVEGDGIDPAQEFDKRLSRILMVAATKWDANDLDPRRQVLIGAGELDL